MEENNNIYNENLKRAEQILGEIFMVTSGIFNPPENPDWAQEHLLEIFEMIASRKQQVRIYDFINDLQTIIFDESSAKQKAKAEWKAETLGGSR